MQFSTSVQSTFSPLHSLSDPRLHILPVRDPQMSTHFLSNEAWPMRTSLKTMKSPSHTELTEWSSRLRANVISSIPTKNYCSKQLALVKATWMKDEYQFAWNSSVSQYKKITLKKRILEKCSYNGLIIEKTIN